MPTTVVISTDAIAVDHEITLGEAEIGKRGEPDLIDSLNVVASFEDATGWTDDDGSRRVIGSQRGRIMCVPGGFPPLEHSRDFFAGHYRSF